MPSKDRALLIIGNGPSTRELARRGFENLPKELDTFGMGAAYRYFHSVGWWPTYYALADSKVVYSHRGELASLITDPKVTTRRFFFPLPLADSPKLKVIPHSSTGDFCFREAVRMGYTTIYLIGVEGDYVEEIPECRAVSNRTAERLGLDKLSLPRRSRANLRIITRSPVTHANYFFDWYQTKGDVYSLPMSDVHRQKWREAAELAEEAGVKVYNLSPASTLTEFPRASVSRLLPRAASGRRTSLFRQKNPRNVAIFFPTLRTDAERTFWRSFLARLRARGYDPVVVLRRTAEVIDAETALGRDTRIVYLPKSLFGLAAHPDFQAFAAEAPRLEPRFPRAIEDYFVESEFLPALLIDRDTHHGAHRQHRAGVVAYNNWLVAFLQDLRIGKVVINNDTFMKSAAVRVVADLAGIDAVHCERSPTTTTWFEKSGFYAHSEAAAFLADGKWRKGGAHERAGQALVAALRADASGHRSMEAGSEAAPEQPFPGEGRRRFLLPLDAVTNTGWAPRGHHLGRANYPLFETPMAAIKTLQAIAEAHDALLVVKPHPSDKFLRAAPIPDGVAIYTGPLETALEQSDLVFCFLTKVAFSALAADKPVVTLSPNVAALSEATFHCDSVAELPRQVERALHDKGVAARRTRFARFLGYLDRQMFVAEDLSNPGAKRALALHFPAIEPTAARDADFEARVAAFDTLAPDPVEGDDGSIIYGPFARERGRRIEEVDIVAELFASGAIEASDDPVMLDVGACKGAAFARFAERGWTVHAFEPNPPMHQHIKQHLALSPHSAKVTLNQLAVSERSGEELPFYTSEESVGISSLSPFRDSHKPTAIVKTIRLDEYCAAAGVRKIDFLKVDTEGFDLFVLKSFNWRRSKPRVIVCEFENAKTERLGYAADDVIAYLHGRGYTVYVSEWHPITRYGGGEHRWRQMLRAPTDRLADDSWGNLIAFRDPIDEEVFAQHTRQVVELMSLKFFESIRRIELRNERDARAAAADQDRIDQFLAAKRLKRQASGDGDGAAPEAPTDGEPAAGPGIAAQPPGVRAVAFVGGFLRRHAWLPVAWLAFAGLLLFASLNWTVWAALLTIGWAGLIGSGLAIMAVAYAQHLHLRLWARHDDLAARHADLLARHDFLNGTVDDLRRRMDEAEARLQAREAPARRKASSRG